MEWDQIEFIYLWKLYYGLEKMTYLDIFDIFDCWPFERTLELKMVNFMSWDKVKRFIAKIDKLRK